MRKIRGPKPRGHGRIAGPPAAPPDNNALKPAFTFERLASGFTLDECDVRERADFAKGLQDRGRLVWAELVQTPHKGLGSEKIAALKVPIPAGVPADEILAFRFGALARFLGFRDGRLCHVVWIDARGRTYDHG